jgi:hypothetical protein
MECSICFNAITAATGKVELSCSHPFHFSCLTTWFDKQKIQGACENCPLCRHEANEFEKMPAGLEDEDDEDDDETWDADDEEPTLDELAAQERARHRFARYKLINPIEEVELYAANLIKACWRGYQDRLLYVDLLDNKFDADQAKEEIIKNKANLRKFLNREKLLKATIGLSRMQVKGFAATKLQSFWRRHKVEAAIGSMSGLWRKIRPGHWEKVVMNPEEDQPAPVAVPPSTLV